MQGEQCGDDGLFVNNHCFLFVIILILHLINMTHAISLHRGNLLTEQDEVEAGQRLDWLMVDDIAVYLLTSSFAQGFVVAGLQSFFIDESDVPEGEVTDDVMLHRFFHIVPLMDKS